MTKNDSLGKTEPEKKVFKDDLPNGDIIDTELFIKQAFQTDYLKGCELLFKRYYKPLCSHAARFVYSRTIAEDLVMDVFSKFWQYQSFKDITCSYRAYLFMSVRYAAYAYLKQEFGKEFTIVEASDVTHSSSQFVQTTPHQILQYHELQQTIEEILKSIPTQSQRVFIMSRFEGKKNKVIAEELNISLKTVEGHMTKALAILKKSLQQAGYVGIVVGANMIWLVQQTTMNCNAYIETSNI